MPVMTGFEATRAIREYEGSQQSPQHATIIALTGLASGRDQSEGLSAGCDIYMTKPVSFKEMGKLLDSWEEDRRNFPDPGSVTVGGLPGAPLPHDDYRAGAF